MKLSIGFSPCPNDSFIFDALVNHKIDTGGLSFEVYTEDVETLNEWALQGKLDITKLSYAVLPLVLENYILLNSGSALGTGVGPILVSNQPLAMAALNIEENTVALPGEHTTAHLLFSLAYPKAKNKVFLPYHEIEDFVQAGKGVGVIIHENRFTYAARGLFKIADLGEYWEKETGNPIPLGGIVVKRSIKAPISLQVDHLVKKSIAYAYAHHYKNLSHFVKEHAQELSESIMREHIDLYVNDYSSNLGEKGRKAVIKLLQVYHRRLNNRKFSETEIFITS